MNNLQVTIDGQGGTIQPDGMVRMGSDDRMNVLFYNKSVHDPMKSRELGRPWHRKMIYVRIQQPGEKDFVDRPVEEYDTAKQRWPRHWAAFEKGAQAVPNGTPVDLLFPQNPEIPANLHSLGVHTVEQLAGLTEHGAQTIGMGSTQWRNKAKEYLDAAKGGVTLQRFQMENEKLRNTAEVQANQIAQLKTQIDRLMAMQNQKIPASMIPNGDPTLAQQAYQPQAPQTFANDLPMSSDALEHAFDPEDSFAPPLASSAEPLFIEEPEGDGAQAETETEADQPKRRGRPPGPRH